MARYVRVSAVAPAPHQMDTRKDLNACVDEMIGHWDKWLEKVICDKPDLVVLPEACDRAPNFSPQRRLEYYEVRGDRICDHFAGIAREYKCNIAYSSCRKLEDGTFRNCTQFINRKGGLDGTYNKNYLVIDENTDGGILYGKDAPVIKTDFCTVGGVICFDLNYNELRERYVKNPPEILVFSSMYHGGLMQNYWAYSCRSYFVGAVPASQCTVINPVGMLVAQSTNYYNYLVADINLDYKLAHLDHNRGRFEAAKKKYGDGFKVTDPGYLGCMMLTSECEGISCDEIVKEFEIELLDDYFARSIEARYIPGRMEP